MLIIVAKNKDAYLNLPKETLKALLKCPCGACQFILWGMYSRILQPGDVLLRIQRVRCKVCGRTHGVLPSFVLGRVRYSAALVQGYFEKWINSAVSLSRLWFESEFPQDISTLYQWGCRFRPALSEVGGTFTDRAFIYSPGH